MSTTIILTNPPEYDLQALAETTKQALALLKPWTQLDATKDQLTAEIVSQAGKYVSAIQQGVSAAYSGFTVTEEVLFLASALPIEDKEDLQDYLVGMMDLAREARENSNKAFDAFRNVRQEIFATMDHLKQEKKLSDDHGGAGSSSNNHVFPKHSLDDIDVLVKFSDSISRFANWWDWVKIETDPSPPKGQPISFQLDTLKEPSIVKRWNGLRSQYTAYVQMISELEDADPAFFQRGNSPDPGRSSGTPTFVPVSTEPKSITINHAPLPLRATSPVLSVDSHPGVDAHTSVDARAGAGASTATDTTSVNANQASPHQYEAHDRCENGHKPCIERKNTILDTLKPGLFKKFYEQIKQKKFFGRIKSILTPKNRPNGPGAVERFINRFHIAGWKMGSRKRDSLQKETKGSTPDHTSSAHRSTTPPLAPVSTTTQRGASLSTLDGGSVAQRPATLDPGKPLPPTPVPAEKTVSTLAPQPGSVKPILAPPTVNPTHNC